MSNSGNSEKLTPISHKKAKAAQQYADSAVRGIRRNLRFIYLVALSLTVVLATAGRRMLELQENCDALEFAAQFTRGGGGNLRQDYCWYTADELDIEYEIIGPGPYFGNQRKDLHYNDVDFFGGIYNELSLSCLGKYLVPINELITELGERRLFADSDDMPVEFNPSAPAHSVLRNLVESHRVRLLDIDSLDDAICRGLNTLTTVDPSQSSPIEYFPDSGEWDVYTYGPPPYEIDPRFPVRTGETHLLMGREVLKVSWPFRDRFCAENFRLIDESLGSVEEDQQTYVELRLRFSDSRPEIGTANAFEDSSTFTLFASEHRWPEASNATNGVSVIWNRFGDLYLLLRAPVIEGTVKGPVAWAESLDDNGGDGLLERIDGLATELERGEQSEQSFDLTLRGARGDLERARAEASVGIGDFRLPLVVAVPVIGIVQAFCMMLIIMDCAGLQRAVVKRSLPKGFFGLQTGLAFHRSGLVRRAVPLGAVAIACGAAVWANDMVEHQGVSLYSTVAAYVVALVLALFAGRRLAGLESQR